MCDPEFVWVPLAIRDPHGIVAWPASSRLTPGTLSVDLTTTAVTCWCTPCMSMILRTLIAQSRALRTAAAGHLRWEPIDEPACHRLAVAAGAFVVALLLAAWRLLRGPYVG